MTPLGRAAAMASALDEAADTIYLFGSTPKGWQYHRLGRYTRCEGMLNGLPYYEQEGGQNSMWFSGGVWRVGTTSGLGTTSCGLDVRNVFLPQDATSTFKVFDGDALLWHEAPAIRCLTSAAVVGGTLSLGLSAFFYGEVVAHPEGKDLWYFPVPPKFPPFRV